ncbi:hypothetical protein PUN28_011963 [Cardiocondyla obscurior]|uniref:Uncharacterized protein n=1 Tax=Cardiocondyla obscurior TaxID=286306 RepID=A0AAW2FCJ4_9HYME
MLDPENSDEEKGQPNTEILGFSSGNKKINIFYTCVFLSLNSEVDVTTILTATYIFLNSSPFLLHKFNLYVSSLIRIKKFMCLFYHIINSWKICF